jgi:hypothetical protein
MSDLIEQKTQPATEVEKRESDPLRPLRNKPQWETPKLEDVSEQVMAQPYIRFT